MAFYTTSGFDPQTAKFFPQPHKNPYNPLRSKSDNPNFEQHPPTDIYPEFVEIRSYDPVPLYAKWEELVNSGLKVLKDIGHKPLTDSDSDFDSVPPVVLLVTIEGKRFILKLFPPTKLGRRRFRSEKKAYENLNHYAKHYLGQTQLPVFGLRRLPWPACYGEVRVPTLIETTSSKRFSKEEVHLPQPLVGWLPERFCHVPECSSSLERACPTEVSHPKRKKSSYPPGTSKANTANPPKTKTVILRSLLIEYLGDSAKNLTRLTLTPTLANDAIRGLDIIHKALVLHGDFVSSQPYNFRNLMLVPRPPEHPNTSGSVSDTNDVVWIDFDHAQAFVSPELTPKFTQYAIRYESNTAWSTFFNYALPTKDEIFYVETPEDFGIKLCPRDKVIWQLELKHYKAREPQLLDTDWHLSG